MYFSIFTTTKLKNRPVSLLFNNLVDVSILNNDQSMPLLVGCQYPYRASPNIFY